MFDDDRGGRAVRAGPIVRLVPSRKQNRVGGFARPLTWLRHNDQFSGLPLNFGQSLIGVARHVRAKSSDSPMTTCMSR